MGITVENIETPGSWAFLNAAEMEIVRECLERKKGATPVEECG
jgi:hypothetical protein